MNFSALTLDDLMNSVLTELIKRPFNLISSRSGGGLGPTSEILGAMLHLQNPRFRLSRDEVKGTVFSALGELLWYLSKDNDLEFISYYIKAYEKESEDNKTVYGGYGPRLFNFRGRLNQIENIIKLLKDRPTTRKAVIQIFDADDLAIYHKEIPCTCTLQFFVRENKLHMFTSMRSNDAYTGLPHDVFAFTMVQEIIARSISVDIGEYYHAVGSLHLYERDKYKAEEYLKAGFQPTTFPMPDMPIGPPSEAIKSLLDIEHSLRKGEIIDISSYSKIGSYWIDFAYLLHAFSIFKKNSLDKGDQEQIDIIKKSLSSNVYDAYIKKRTEEILHRQNSDKIL